MSLFIVAENRLLREALGRVFNKKSDIEVIGSAQLCQDALEEISAAEPDILLLNPASPALVDAECLGGIRQVVPQVKVVLFGMEENEATFFTAVRAGVIGYVLKDASACDVVTAVRVAVQGEAVCPPRLCLMLFGYVARQATMMPSIRLSIRFGLTRREQQLIPMIGQGLTNKEIASRLNLSEQTIKNHIHRMMQKAGASSRLAVVERCRMDNVFA